VLPQGLGVTLDASTWPMLPVFAWLAREGGVAPEEMARTFNCGIGMVAVVAKERADDVLNALKTAGEDAIVIGDVVPPDGQKSQAKGKGEAWAVKYDDRLAFADNER
jgi:phosphoribosylformylglycinamidine cyclo-ligase